MQLCQNMQPYSIMYLQILFEDVHKVWSSQCFRQYIYYKEYLT